jgi:hypothetical protein
MANYYLGFSAMLLTQNNDELEWCRSKLREYQDSDPGDEDWKGDFSFRVETKEKDGQDGIWFYTEENGEPSHVADFVQEFLKRFDRPDVWVMEWSNWCEKPRLDAYGGGAVVVTKDGQEWLSTSLWVDLMTEKLQKATKKTKTAKKGKR